MALTNLSESSNLGLMEVIQEPSAGFIDIKSLIFVNDENNENQEIEIPIEDFQAPAKLHIGFLSISLIVGLAYGGYVGYMCWREKSVFLSHIRNLVIALTCRTFFSILFEGVIILNSPQNVGGGNTLLAFECICLNLVLACWLTLTLYIHERVQRNFNNEPSLTLYVYGIPGIAVYFALVWIFAMEGTHSSKIWWLIYHFRPLYQWVVNSLRLLFLLAQLALLFNTGKMMMVKTTDNDSVSLLRRVALMMGALVLLFWFQFGFSVGRPPLDNIKPYLYFYYIIDGTQCLFVCVVLFFFNMWVIKMCLWSYSFSLYYGVPLKKDGKQDSHFAISTNSHVRAQSATADAENGSSIKSGDSVLKNKSRSG